MMITLDGLQMTDRIAAHDHLAAQLKLPEYYGRNLDALYDLLMEISEETHITLEHQENLNEYAMRIVQTISDAAADNNLIFFTKKDC